MDQSHHELLDTIRPERDLTARGKIGSRLTHIGKTSSSQPIRITSSIHTPHYEIHPSLQVARLLLSRRAAGCRPAPFANWWHDVLQVVVVEGQHFLNPESMACRAQAIQEEVEWPHPCIQRLGHVGADIFGTTLLGLGPSLLDAFVATLVLLIDEEVLYTF